MQWKRESVLVTDGREKGVLEEKTRSCRHPEASSVLTRVTTSSVQTAVDRGSPRPCAPPQGEPKSTSALLRAKVGPPVTQRTDLFSQRSWILFLHAELEEGGIRRRREEKDNSSDAT